MFKHRHIWSAIDNLAKAHGLSPSGLARKAGLDATAFNRSKRLGPGGRPRWPSTESISRILRATGAGVGEIFAHLSDTPAQTQRIPILGMAQAGKEGYFDDAGYPTGQGWDEIYFPEIKNPEQAYALEISGNSMEPVYREGDIVIVAPSLNARRGDRVVVKTTPGEVMAKELLRRTARRLCLRSLNPTYGDIEKALSEIVWIARIVWASQ